MKTILVLIVAFLVGFFSTTWYDSEIMSKQQQTFTQLRVSNVTCLNVKKTTVYFCF